MSKLTSVRIAVLGAVLLGVMAALVIAAAPAQAAFPASPVYQATVVPPATNPTVVVIPQTGSDASTAPAASGWLIPVLIIVGVALVVLFAVALASRGSRTDV